MGIQKIATEVLALVGLPSLAGTASAQDAYPSLLRTPYDAVKEHEAAIPTEREPA